MEKAYSPELQPVKLKMMDFNMGHWPDTKEPPWLLSELWMANNYKLYEQARSIAKELQPNEEKPLFEAVFEGTLMEVRVFRPDQENIEFYVRAFPKT